MILLLIIILLVIWLIIKVRRQAEYYKVEGLKLSWTNKTNIEGNVTKWIFVLKDKTGNEIHRYENSDAENLKDWTAVSVDVIGKKEFDEKIIGDNTLDIYYNNVEEGKKLYTTTVNYSESDFSGSIDTTNLEEVQEVKPAFSYEFIMNKKNQTLGIHVEYIKLDGVLATKEQTTIHKPPNRNNKPDNMFSIGSGTENYAAWNADGHNVGDKIFTIESYKQIEKIDIAYTRPRYGPGWIIKENGVTKITETYNRGNDTDPRPVVYTYNIKDGTASLPPPQPEAVAVSETQRPNPISLLVASPNACKDEAMDVVWTGTCKVGNLGGVDTFDLSRNNQILSVNSNKKLPKNYTIIYVWKPRNSDSGWRTLHRGDADHWAIVKDGGKELGMYSNRDGGFRGTGYNITPDKWQFLVVTGEGTSDTSSKGTSTFYVDLYDGKGVQKVGTSDRVACGTKFQQIGYAGQEPGYLVAALVLDDILPKSEMEKVSEEAKRHFFDKISSTRGIRYVWFGYEKSGWPERPLNIAEIKVYSGGVNIVKGFGDGKVQSSSIYANWTSPKNLFDGNKSSMAHTNDSGTNYFKIDLGKEYSAIDKVMVHNRDNCCYERWAGSFVKLLDKDGVEIMRSTDTLPIVANKNDSTNITKAKNYKEGGVRVKTFTFDSSTKAPSPPPPPPITEIPHQIPSAAPGGWCNHANAVHQDVPGCGRICSDSNTVGSKDKGTWGSWDAYPGSVNCPAAKLDQVWKMEGGSRKLAIGNYSAAMDLTGGFKWYYYEGSYFSVPSSFNNATPTKTGTGIKNFSNKHNATGGYLPNHGNKSNYAVRWQGRFVPKKTGTHKFWTESDDMSYLYVRNSKVVDNGGLHGMVKKEGTINMTKGKEYLIEIFFGEKGGGDEIKVWFQGPDMSLAKHDFSGYMVNDTKLCSSGMFGGRSNNGITDYKHCMECAHKWEPGQHKRAINCENIWLDD
jgi:fibro-slime domain-containing protein